MQEPWTGAKINDREYTTEASNRDVRMSDDEDDNEEFSEEGKGSIFSP